MVRARESRPAVNTKENEVDAALSWDGNAIIFPSKQADSIAGSTDLYVTRRANGAWSPIENLGPRINTPGTDTWLGHDGHTLYLNSDWDGLVPGEKGPLLVWKIQLLEGILADRVAIMKLSLLHGAFPAVTPPGELLHI